LIVRQIGHRVVLMHNETNAVERDREGAQVALVWFQRARGHADVGQSGPRVGDAAGGAACLRVDPDAGVELLESLAELRR
jgi:hypothetical protein